MKYIFVSGIGTGVGKTIASAILTEKLNADYWKPIQAGDLNNTDSHTVSRLISNSKSTIHKERYLLNTPASPHYAAERENIEINLADFMCPKTDNTLIIEGAGGLMVPINKKGDLIIDLISHLNAEIVLVSQNYLGSINHTLLSVEAIRNRGINILGIIFNGHENIETEKIILNNTQCSLIGNIKQERMFDKELVKNYALTLNI